MTFPNRQDAAREKNLAKGPGGMSPLEWGIAILLLWIVGFPMYLVRRGEAKGRAPQTNEERAAEAARYAGQRSPLMFAVGVIGLLLGGLALMGGLAMGSRGVPGILIGAAMLFGGVMALRKPKAPVLRPYVPASDPRPNPYAPPKR